MQVQRISPSSPEILNFFCCQSWPSSEWSSAGCLVTASLHLERGPSKHFRLELLLTSTHLDPCPTSSDSTLWALLGYLNINMKYRPSVGEYRIICLDFSNDRTKSINYNLEFQYSPTKGDNQNTKNGPSFCNNILISINLDFYNYEVLLQIRNIRNAFE